MEAKRKTPEEKRAEKREAKTLKAEKRKGKDNGKENLLGGRKKKKGKRIILLIILGLLIIGGIIAFIFWQKSKQSPQSKMRMISAPLEKTDLQVSLSASGTINSSMSYQIYAPSSLEIAEVMVSVGDKVKVGDDLARLDTSSLEYDIKTAELNIENAEASKDSAAKSNSNSVRSAANSADSAKADLEDAQKSYAEQKKAVDAQSKLSTPAPGQDELIEEETQSLSKQEEQAIASTVRQAKLDYEDAQKTYDDLMAQSGSTASVQTAKADYDAAQMTYDQAVSGYSTQNSVTQAQIELDAAQKKYNETVIQQDNSVYSAQIDLDNAAISLDNAQIAADNAAANASDSDSGTNTNSVDSAYNAYQKAQIALSNATINRESNIEAARQSVEKAQIAYDNALKSAESSTQTAKQNLEKARLNYESALQNEDQSLSNAFSALEKAKMNYESALKTQEDSLNSAETALKKAQNSYSTAVENKNAAGQSLASNEISIEMQELSLQKLQDQLAEADMKAPLAGTVTYVSAQLGQPANGLMFVIEDTDNLIVDTTVSESEVNDLKVGQTVLIETDSTGEDVFQGEIITIADSAQKGSDGLTATSTNVVFDVQISIKDKDERLKIGMNAQLSLITEEKNDVLAVSTEAITTRRGESILRVQNGEEIKEVVVQTGLETDTMTEIVSGDVKEGDMIVVSSVSDGATALAEGMEGMPNGMDGMGGNMGGMPAGGGMPGGGGPRG